MNFVEIKMPLILIVCPLFRTINQSYLEFMLENLLNKKSKIGIIIDKILLKMVIIEKICGQIDSF